jgi:large subunit ribosomal protein L31
MKKDLHPQYYPNAKVQCVCGNSWTVGSTAQEIHTSICSKCHPFYTGAEKIVDTRGRVDRFKRQMERSATKSSARAAAPAKTRAAKNKKK